jgi:hypothetical protein
VRRAGSVPKFREESLVLLDIDLSPCQAVRQYLLESINVQVLSVAFPLVVDPRVCEFTG